MSTVIKVLPEFGRCVIAERDIKAGELIECAEILVLSQEDTLKVNQTGLRDYTFTYNDTQDCLVMGIGEMFNHSDMPNATYYLAHVNRERMYFRAVNDIKAGEQIFINYCQDLREGEDKAEYKSNLM